MVRWKQGKLKPLTANTLLNSLEMPRIYSEHSLEHQNNPIALMVLQVWFIGSGTMRPTRNTLAFMASIAITSLIITQGFPHYFPYL
jgi:hypothetical protein